MTARAGGCAPSARPARAFAGPQRAALAALAVLAAALLGACAAAPPPKPISRLDPSLARFLPDPAQLAGATLEPEIGRLHQQLLRGGDPVAVAARAAELAIAAPSDPGARLLVAEARLAGGEAAAALAEIAQIEPGAARDPAVALVAGRAAEELVDLPAAVSWYRLAGAGPGAERVRELEPRATEILLNRGRDQLARGRVDEAERTLALLEQWRQSDLATLELARAVAVARADPRRELAALRALAPAKPEAIDLQLRRGALEVEIGDARAGLDLLAAVASRRPDDPAVADELERAKLVFRLANAPEPVRASASRVQLTRADYARLVYWLLPDVRAARGGAPRIASDILDHPAREEIVRVINLGLLPVDETRHLFEPDRAIRRSDALRALLIDPAGGWRPCARATGGDICGGAVACGLVAEAGECLPSAPLSGREAVDWIRRVPPH